MDAVASQPTDLLDFAVRSNWPSPHSYYSSHAAVAGNTWNSAPIDFVAADDAAADDAAAVVVAAAVAVADAAN